MGAVLISGCLRKLVCCKIVSTLVMHHSPVAVFLIAQILCATAMRPVAKKLLEERCEPEGGWKSWLEGEAKASFHRYLIKDWCEAKKPRQGLTQEQQLEQDGIVQEEWNSIADFWLSEHHAFSEFGRACGGKESYAEYCLRTPDRRNQLESILLS